MTRAYRGPVFGGGSGGTEGLRSRVARGRPNWWVILAVSLGLMALLVATAGSGPRSPAPQARGGPGEPVVHISPGPGLLWSADAATHATTTTTTNVATTTPSTTPRLASGTANVATTRQTSGASGDAGSAGAPPAATPGPTATTTTTVAPATTTTGAVPAVAADRTQTQGYLNPPTESSDRFGFTGTGAMEISVVWSGNTYLTMQVSCPNGGQSVGGTAAMAASLPDASGSCLATVTEPTSETTSLTYTISIGPAGG